jgi:hypothetical protein
MFGFPEFGPEFGLNLVVAAPLPVTVADCQHDGGSDVKGEEAFSKAFTLFGKILLPKRHKVVMLLR